MRKTALFLIAGLVVVLVLASIYALHVRDYSSQLEAAAERRAREAFFRSYFPWVLVPYAVDVTDVSSRIPLWSAHKVYYVRGYAGGMHPPAASVVIAVAGDGETFELPQDFNEVLIREGIKAQNNEDALAIAASYTHLFGFTVLENAFEIPHEIRDISKEVENLITPPRVEKQNETYMVTFYTWKISGGNLDQWTFTIGADGVIGTNREQIEGEVGDYVEPQ